MSLIRHLAVALGTMFLATGFAQDSPAPLTLRDAVNIALEKNPLRKAALADTKAASAGVREAQSFLMPHVTLSETATRGDDPVYVFGSKLRQQRFKTGDFALNKLNTPLPAACDWVGDIPRYITLPPPSCRTLWRCLCQCACLCHRRTR